MKIRTNCICRAQALELAVASESPQRTLYQYGAGLNPCWGGGSRTLGRVLAVDIYMYLIKYCLAHQITAKLIATGMVISG